MINNNIEMQNQEITPSEAIAMSYGTDFKQDQPVGPPSGYVGRVRPDMKGGYKSTINQIRELKKMAGKEKQLAKGPLYNFNSNQ